MAKSPLIQILPVHPQHAESVQTVLNLRDYTNIKISLSRRLSPAVLIVTRCQNCPTSSIDVSPYILRPRQAQLLFLDFKHIKPGTNDIDAAGVVLQADLSDVFIANLIDVFTYPGTKPKRPVTSMKRLGRSPRIPITLA